MLSEGKAKPKKLKSKTKSASAGKPPPGASAPTLTVNKTRSEDLQGRLPRSGALHAVHNKLKRTNRQRLHSATAQLAELSTKYYSLLRSVRASERNQAAKLRNQLDSTTTDEPTTEADGTAPSLPLAAGPPAAADILSLGTEDLPEMDYEDHLPDQAEPVAEPVISPVVDQGPNMAAVAAAAPAVAAPVAAPVATETASPTIQQMMDLIHRLPNATCSSVRILLQALVDRGSLTVRENQQLDSLLHALVTDAGAGHILNEASRQLTDEETAVLEQAEENYNTIQHIKAGVEQGVVPPGHLNVFVDKQLELLDSHAGERAQPATSPASANATAANSTVHRLVQRPETFSGSKDSKPVRAWLKAMNNFLNTAKCNPQTRVETAVTYLRGKAESYWFAASPGLKQQGQDITAWDTFADCLVMGFGAHDPEIAARSKIAALTQTGSVEAYVRELQSLFADLHTTPMSEADKVFAFMRGLKSDISAMVQVDPLTKEPWATFQAAAHYAIRHDMAVHMARKNTHQSTSAKFAAKSAAKSAAGVPGAFVKIAKGGHHVRGQHSRPYGYPDSYKKTLLRMKDSANRHNNRGDGAGPSNVSRQFATGQGQGQQQGGCAICGRRNHPTEACRFKDRLGNSQPPKKR